MSYERPGIGTKGALGCVVMTFALGLLAVWLFFEEIRMPPLIYDGPPIGVVSPPEEQPPPESEEVS